MTTETEKTGVARVDVAEDTGRVATALVYGFICHVSFAAAVALMFYALDQGLSIGRGSFHGGTAILADTLLLLQFPLIHSCLLTERGRKALRVLAPNRYASQLQTTVYSTVASLQLLLVFYFWSPSGLVLYNPPAAIKAVLTVLYCLSWLLLARAMADAGLGIQTGYAGWVSMYKNQKPKFKNFSTKGLFRYTREPVYLAFTLVLWTAPVWTADRLALTVVWTAYCILAPRLKEQRYVRWFGSEYAAYQQAVNYWLPDLRLFRSQRLQ